jgi:DNA mismatch endonuclease (patch repair protein)
MHWFSFRDRYNFVAKGRFPSVKKMIKKHFPKMSEAKNKYFAIPENRKKVTDGLLKYYSNPENRMQHALAFQSVEYRKKTSDRLRVLKIIPWNKGKIMSKEYCKNVSITTKKGMNNEQVRSKCRLAKLGKSHTPWSSETKQKFRLAALKQWKDPEHRKLREKIYAEPAFKEKFSKFFKQKWKEPDFIAKHIAGKRYANTKPEVKLQNELKARNCEFVTQYNVFGRPDIAFPKEKIAIFVDGIFWHSKEKSKHHDEEVNHFLQQNGWKVMRYTDKEILANAEAAGDEIEDMIIVKGGGLP